MRIAVLTVPSGHSLQLCVEFSFENYERAYIEQWVSNLDPNFPFLTEVLQITLTLAAQLLAVLYSSLPNNILYQNVWKP